MKTLNEIKRRMEKAKRVIKRWLRGWLDYDIRNEFIRQEVKPGKMLVVWVDCDEMVYGWTLSADEEQDLLKVAALIWDQKNKKTESIINAKGERNG